MPWCGSARSTTSICLDDNAWLGRHSRRADHGLGVACCSADQVPAAMLAGYEAMIRLGRAIEGPRFSIAASGRLTSARASRPPRSWRACSARRTADRPRVGARAYPQRRRSATITRRRPALARRWACCAHGLAAAFAAQAGFTADLNLLRVRLLPGVYGVTPDVAALTMAGDALLLAEVSFKPWCAARQTMAATQALREISRPVWPPDDIRGHGACCRRI